MIRNMNTESEAHATKLKRSNECPDHKLLYPKVTDACTHSHTPQDTPKHSSCLLNTLPTWQPHRSVS